MPEDETKPPFPVEIEQKAPPDSQLFNVSIRGWLAIILTGTICLSRLAEIIPAVLIAWSKQDLTFLSNITTVNEPLYSMAVAALGFYFGQKKQ